MSITFYVIVEFNIDESESEYKFYFENVHSYEALEPEFVKKEDEIRDFNAVSIQVSFIYHVFK